MTALQLKKILFSYIVVSVTLFVSGVAFAETQEFRLKINTVRNAFYADPETGKLTQDPQGFTEPVDRILKGLKFRISYRESTDRNIARSVLSTFFPLAIRGGSPRESEEIFPKKSTLESDGSILLTFNLPNKFIQDEGFFRELHLLVNYLNGGYKASCKGGNYFSLMGIKNYLNNQIPGTCQLGDYYNIDSIVPVLDQSSNFYFFGKQKLKDNSDVPASKAYFYELAFSFQDSQRTLRQEIENIAQKTLQSRKEEQSELLEVNMSERTPKGQRSLSTFAQLKSKYDEYSARVIVSVHFKNVEQEYRVRAFVREGKIKFQFPDNEDGIGPGAYYMEDEGFLKFY